MHELRRISGRWRGTYEYDPSDKIPKMGAVRFMLTLKQGWFGHFTGTVTEDAPEGTPGTGAIDGYFSFPRIEFKKQMPVAYVIQPDGRHVTLRESLIAKGYACEQDMPGLEIVYQGEFHEANRAKGAWIINARRIPLSEGLVLPVPQMTGVWTVELETV